MKLIIILIINMNSILIDFIILFFLKLRKNKIIKENKILFM